MGFGASGNTFGRQNDGELLMFYGVLLADYTDWDVWI